MRRKQSDLLRMRYARSLKRQCENMATVATTRFREVVNSILNQVSRRLRDDPDGNFNTEIRQISMLERQLQRVDTNGEFADTRRRLQVCLFQEIHSNHCCFEIHRR
jgi:hypothetical protein